MVPRRTINRPHISPAQAAIRDEIEQLLKVLQLRSNRDKLEDREFLLAGSLLERWKWNASAISDDDLPGFLNCAQDLVTQIEAVDLLTEHVQTASRVKPKQSASRVKGKPSGSNAKIVLKN